MINNIIFLGTAGDSTTYAKQFRYSGGIIFKINGIQLHLDPGPGALVRASQMKINIRETTAVMVSNKSIVKSNDLNALIAGMSYEGLDRKSVVIAKKNIVNNDEDPTKELLIRKDCIHYVEKIIGLEPKQKVGIADIEVQSTKCYGTNSIGFKIITSDYTIGYTSDTEYSEKLVAEFQDTNILIVNCRNPENSKSKGTMNSSDVTKLSEKIKPDLIILTGFGIKMLEQNPILEARKIQKQTGVQTVAAKDGLVLNPDSYSSGKKQKMLKNF